MRPEFWLSLFGLLLTFSPLPSRVVMQGQQRKKKPSEGEEKNEKKMRKKSFLPSSKRHGNLFAEWTNACHKLLFGRFLSKNCYFTTLLHVRTKQASIAASIALFSSLTYFFLFRTAFCIGMFLYACRYLLSCKLVKLNYSFGRKCPWNCF